MDPSNRSRQRTLSRVNDEPFLSLTFISMGAAYRSFCLSSGSTCAHTFSPCRAQFDWPYTPIAAGVTVSSSTMETNVETAVPARSIFRLTSRTLEMAERFCS